MSRLETVRENWADITNKLLRDKQLLAHFLRFSAGMYKQSFSDAALIYQQNPYATKVAMLETWNKLGRLVNKGEHSIAVFGEDSKAKHLFDISQTNGKRIPDLWKLTEDLAADLTAVINKKYGRDCKNIQETIAAMSVDNTRPHLTEMMYATQQLKLTDSELKTYQQSVPEEQQTSGTEAAVSEVSEETGVSGTTESVVSDIPDTAMTAKNAQAFLLLAAVFGAVIAAMVLKRKFQKDKPAVILRSGAICSARFTCRIRHLSRAPERKSLRIFCFLKSEIL